MTDRRCEIISTTGLENKDAKWVGLYLTKYRDPNGRERSYEFSHRLTRPKNTDADSVGIVAILVNSPRTEDTGSSDTGTSGPRILLQKQFRPPVGKYCIEVPAGLIDEGETPEACALRELKEETGYTGRLLHSSGSGASASTQRFAITPSPLMYNDPGSTTTSVRMIHVSVDLADPANHDVQPQLEEGEFIENFSVPIASLWEECSRFEGEGYTIDARVGTLAEGVELARGIWAFGSK